MRKIRGTMKQPTTTNTTQEEENTTKSPNNTEEEELSAMELGRGIRLSFPRLYTQDARR